MEPSRRPIGNLLTNLFGGQPSRDATPTRARKPEAGRIIHKARQLQRRRAHNRFAAATRRAQRPTKRRN
jgi:hypothetical protein